MNPVNQAPTGTTDPLHLLPSEIVLRILDFASASSLASLLRLNRDWKHFIDENQELIYSDASKTEHSKDAKSFSFLAESRTFTNYFADVSSWKDLCKRQTLLGRNWSNEAPITRESMIRVEEDPVWRFRPDFKRRFFLSTSQGGGLFVTDFDTGLVLWSLDGDTVRAFAHLEYQDGTAVFDREGDALEVWRTDLDGLGRGQFRQVAILPHDRQTRGFQLSFDTLCVVSSQGEGYVYDMPGIPRLRTKIEIERQAVGHLDQGPDAVVYSLGKKGYHFYDKTSGQRLGVLSPQFCADTYHIIHPASDADLHPVTGNRNGLSAVYPPRHPRRDRTTPIYLESGPYPPTRPHPTAPLEDDEWGAGMLNGDLFVGISRGGRVMICPDWRKALKDDADQEGHISIIECDCDGSNFDLGGWLSIRNHRILFEIQDRAYVVGLTDSNNLSTENSARPTFAFSTSLAPQMSTAVSFMALYDDCIMSTYTTLRLRSRPTVGMARAVPTKAIRVLGLAPGDESPDNTVEDRESPLENAERYFERMLNVGIHPFVAAMMDPDELDADMEEAESLAVEVDEETELEHLD